MGESLLVGGETSESSSKRGLRQLRPPGHPISLELAGKRTFSGVLELLPTSRLALGLPGTNQSGRQVSKRRFLGNLGECTLYG